MNKQFELNFDSLRTEAKNAIKNKQNQQDKPLAYELRPQNLSEYFGQQKQIKYLERKVQTGLNHIIFFGPPGCGKTTIAHLLAKISKTDLYPFNAVISGVKELRDLISSIEFTKSHSGKQSIIFIDEIHRFNKAQQDALLPYLESNQFILLGATTEYPQTSLNRALISRVEIIELNKLEDVELEMILKNAATKKDIELRDEQIKLISMLSNGDARIALNQLEILAASKDELKTISLDELKANLLKNARHFDKDSNRHYDVISAFIKSIRGSDHNAALMWLAIMIDGGEDPAFIARRLMISAAEDIGLADPQALGIATNAHYAVKNIGMPEARIILAQATIYLAQSKKSNSAYLAIDNALEYVRSNPTIEVPGYLKSSGPEKTKYLYPHDFENHHVAQKYTLDKNHKTFFTPSVNDQK